MVFSGRRVLLLPEKLSTEYTFGGGGRATVKVRLRTTYEAGTGGKVWDATPILAKWALAQPAVWRGQDVHELGAGLGQPDLALAHLSTTMLVH